MIGIGLTTVAMVLRGLGFLALWAYAQLPAIVTLTNSQRIQPGSGEAEVEVTNARDLVPLVLATEGTTSVYLRTNVECQTNFSVRGPFLKFSL